MKWLTDPHWNSSFSTYYKVGVRRTAYGLFEFYCEEQKRFLQYDRLEACKRAIRQDLKHRK